jgi:ABC-type glycerol-3-phosphate transport system permease component
LSNTLLEETSFEVPLEVREKPPSNKTFLISLITPSIFIFILIILFPIIIGIIVSFRNSTGTTGYFGDRFTLTNFYWVLFRGDVRTRDFWQYTYQTLFFAGVSIIIEFILGLLFAKLLNKKFRGRGLARATILIPWALPTIASATIFRYEIFAPADQFGLVNNFLELLSLRPVAFFGPDAEVLFKLPTLVPYDPFITEIDITATMFTAIAIDVWKTTPFLTLLILAVLQIVPEDLNKAAEIAGANNWQKFRYITWPLIKPGVGVALVFRMMDALRVYDAIVVFRDKEVRSMTWQAADFWLSGQEYGLASVVAIILFLFIIGFALLITRFSQKETKTRGSTSKKRKEESTEFSSSSIDMEDEQDITSIHESDVKVREFSESKLKLIRIKLRSKKVFFMFAVIFMCLFCAAPFIWILLRSFRDPFIAQTDFEFWPKFFSGRAYGVVFETSEFTGVSFNRALLNGFLLSGLTVVVVLIIGSLIAYALAKFDFSGKVWINGFIFTMTSLPPLIIIIPFFIQTATISDFFLENRAISSYIILILGIIFIVLSIGLYIQPNKYKKKHFIATLIVIIIVCISSFVFMSSAPADLFDLRDNIFGLVFPYSALNLPLAVFVLQAFFREIPEDLWKAAKVDGASNFQIFRKVILPLTIPGIFTVAILVFIASWNELLFAQIWLVNDINHTVPRAILRFVQSPLSLTADWDTDIALMAATSIATVPLVILVLIFQKKIISGLTRGAVKG